MALAFHNTRNGAANNACQAKPLGRPRPVAAIAPEEVGPHGGGRACACEVDVQILNEAPTFCYHVSRGGALCSNDDGALIAWRERIWREYFDFQPYLPCVGPARGRRGQRRGGEAELASSVDGGRTWSRRKLEYRLAGRPPHLWAVDDRARVLDSRSRRRVVASWIA